MQNMFIKLSRFLLAKFKSGQNFTELLVIELAFCP